MYVKFGATVHLRAACRNAPSIFARTCLPLSGCCLFFRPTPFVTFRDPFMSMSGSPVHKVLIESPCYLFTTCQRTTVPLPHCHFLTATSVDCLRLRHRELRMPSPSLP